MGIATRILGPRIPRDELTENRLRYRLPTSLFMAAMLALLLSLFFPYWVLHLKAPQFPHGLKVTAYVNRLEGRVDPVTNSNDLEQLDELNHYVGMASLDDGAEFERTIAVATIVVFAGLLGAAVYVNSRYVLLMVLPAVLFPLAFLIDLQYWLWRYGHSLDPRAPLAGAVGEFTPHLFGPSSIAQFKTMALPGIGLILAVVASILSIIGLVKHRQAYRPLVLAAEAAAAGAQTTGVDDSERESGPGSDDEGGPMGPEEVP